MSQLYVSSSRLVYFITWYFSTYLVQGFLEWLNNSRQWNAWQTPRYLSLVNHHFLARNRQLTLAAIIDGIHLKQCVTLYLFALPLTLVNDMGWATIPIATVVAFTFMGIEGIADEIEMPFGSFFTLSIVDLSTNFCRRD